MSLPRSPSPVTLLHYVGEGGLLKVTTRLTLFLLNVYVSGCQVLVVARRTLQCRTQALSLRHVGLSSAHCFTACKILVPGPRIEAPSFETARQVLNPWVTGEDPD